MNDKVKEWIETHEGDDYCKYCLHDDECPHGMVCYGDEPIEPRCCSVGDIAEILDMDMLVEDIELEDSL